MEIKSLSLSSKMEDPISHIHQYKTSLKVLFSWETNTPNSMLFLIKLLTEMGKRNIVLFKKKKKNPFRKGGKRRRKDLLYHDLKQQLSCLEDWCGLWYSSFFFSFSFFWLPWKMKEHATKLKLWKDKQARSKYAMQRGKKEEEALK